ncbi:thioesterase II family protein [Microbispora sp. H10670]|uniref:thioesterase II family protein n=1 Tax=Microbispora sp. H10670 TaxID=2729108 RepID=UPI001603AC2D|nr:alpha/beta fold hydrolase [Microbispora sp. H10670]
MPLPNPNAGAVAYGIAHAGAGAAPWNAVARVVAPDIEVRGIRLPGREKRVRQRPHATVAEAAAEIAAVLAGDTRSHGRPILVVGSCSGALLAYEALAIVHTSGTVSVPVLGLLVARQPPPGTTAPEAERPVSAMTSAELRAWLRENELTPAEIRDDESLFRFFEPVLRADLMMTEGYVGRPGEVSCPITLLRARSRPLSAAYVKGWRAATSGPLRVVDIPVREDALAEAPASLADALLGTVRRGETAHGN